MLKDAGVPLSGLAAHHSFISFFVGGFSMQAQSSGSCGSGFCDAALSVPEVVFASIKTHEAARTKPEKILL